MTSPAVVVVVAGIAAALHVGKLPPALPILQEQLGISLLQAGFLLSMVQLAGMAFGLAAGRFAQARGPRRTMLWGLLVLAAASIAGAYAHEPAVLLTLRAVEGAGFLLASLPAPGLIRALVPADRVSRALGWWGAYMPIGTASALLLGPAVIAAWGWPVLWWLLGAVSIAAAAWLASAVPADSPAPPGGTRGVIAQTLSARGPWLAALCFAVYSGQWLAVVGFLPSIYAQAGWDGSTAAVATALAAGINMAGNIASGRLQHRGWRADHLLVLGFAGMAVGAVAAFAPWSGVPGDSWSTVLRYGGVLLFSMVGGIVPGTLFSVAVRVAPHEHAVSTTVGWMQQWSSAGQFGGPPLVAWVAAHSGHWGNSWMVTGACALTGIVLARMLRRELASVRIPTIGA